MIVEKDGRSRSIRTADEARKLLEKELSSLTPDEQAALQALLSNPEAAASIPSAMAELEYEQEPVSIEQFVNDPYYLGNTCSSLFPRLLEDLIELFDGTYHEAVFTGAIGWGKTFLASIGVCRILYELSCLRSPQETFGLAPGSNISLVMLSVNEQLATKVVYENITGKLQASPYFKEKFPFEITKKEMRFPNSVWVAPRASTDTSVLGLNVFGGVLDETNFMPQKTRQKAFQKHFGNTDRAETLYAAIQRRMKSRFNRFGRIPGMLFIVSSKNRKDDFTDRKVKGSKGDSTVFCRDYALWDVRPEEYYSAKRFWVLCGNEKTPSRVVADGEDITALRGALPDDVVLVDVPEDFRPDFDSDLEGAIRDIAGVATVSVSPFINRRDKIEDAIDKSREHPFTSLELDPAEGGSFRWDLLVGIRQERTPWGEREAVPRPLLHPNAPRNIHIDSSLSQDATGFAMGHVAGYVEVIRKMEGGGQYTERAPVIVVDVLLRVVPPLGDEIMLSDVRQLVYDLSTHGFSIASITMDSYQSADAIQKFGQKGFNAEILSVDRTMEPYDCLKLALYEGRLKFYRYEPLMEELRALERDLIKKKVDHPPGGSKDVADALAGICYTLTQKAAFQPLPIMRSSQFGDGSWLPEQRQAAMAGDTTASQNQDMLPPFLNGSDPFGGWGWGSGR